MKAEFITYSKTLNEYILFMYYGDVLRMPFVITKEQFDIIYKQVGIKSFKETKSQLTYTLN